MQRLLTESLPLFAVSLLGQTTLPDPQSSESIGWLLLALAAVVGMANQGLDLWRKMFPAVNPPAHEVYATKSELIDIRREHAEDVERIEKRFEKWIEALDQAKKREMELLDAWRSSQQTWMQSIERAVGRIEAKTETKTSGK